jgi:hypothetical protein
MGGLINKTRNLTQISMQVTTPSHSSMLETFSRSRSWGQEPIMVMLQQPYQRMIFNKVKSFKLITRMSHSHRCVQTRCSATIDWGRCQPMQLSPKASNVGDSRHKASDNKESIPSGGRTTLVIRTEGSLEWMPRVKTEHTPRYRIQRAMETNCSWGMIQSNRCFKIQPTCTSKSQEWTCTKTAWFKMSCHIMDINQLKSTKTTQGQGELQMTLFHSKITLFPGTDLARAPTIRAHHTRSRMRSKGWQRGRWTKTRALGRTSTWPIWNRKALRLTRFSTSITLAKSTQPTSSLVSQTLKTPI